jgi:hypothetical protein
MTTSVERAGEHLARAFRALDRVRGDVQSARQLLALLGWDLPPGVDDIGLTLLDVTTLASKLDDLVEVRSREDASDLELATAVAEVILAVADTIDSTDQLIEALEASSDYLDATNIIDEFLPRLGDLLVIHLVGATVQPAIPVGVLVGLFELTLMPADPSIFQVEHVRQVVRWDRVGPLVTDPGGVVRDVYGWGTPDFDGNQLVTNIAGVLEHVAADLRVRPLPRAVEELLVGRPLPDGQVRPLQLFVSLDKGLGFDAHDVGVSLYALGATEVAGSDGGIGISPFVFGTADVSFPLSDRLALEVEGAVEFDTGLALVLRAGADPELVSNLLATPTSGSTDASLGLLLRYTASTGARHVLFSAPGLALDAAAVTAGIGVSAGDLDPAATMGIEDGRLHVAPDRADGFLASILPEDGIDASVELGISWSRSAGVRIVGAAGLHTSIVVHRQLGPFELDRLDLAITANADALLLAATAAGAVTLGPLTATVDGIGAAVALRFRRGNLGPVDLGVDFVPPTGIGLVVDAVAITGGGFIRYDPATKRYAGILELQAGQVGITGVGILDARLPAGAPGYALLIAFRATFPGIPVGFGFELTAVGGLLALNRRVDVDALRARLASGTAGRILAPADPIRDAAALLADLDAAFPVARGVTVVGPTVQLVWAELVTFDIGVFIELPGPSRIVLLGSARAAIEAEGRAYLVIRVDVVGVVDLQQRLAAFDAVLVDSQLLEILDLTGDAAFRMSWGDQPYAVLTLGGFHPAFNPEPLPVPSKLHRIAMVHGQPDDRVYLRFEGYFAVTTNTLQFGASVEAVINAGSFNIQGTLAFDALVQYEPFHFRIDIRASVRVRYKSHNVGGLTLTGSLEGPGPIVLRAKVCIELLFFDICFSDTFTLGSTTPPPVTTVASALEALLAELDRAQNLHASTGADPFVALRPPASGSDRPVLSPAGQLIWAQRLAPLGVLLQKIGGNPLAEAHLVDATSPDGAGAELEWFAPGSFAELTDDDALNRRAFERLTGGLRFGTAGTGDGPARPRTFTIRQIRLPAVEETGRPAVAFPIWLLDAGARAIGARPVDGPVVGVVSVAEELWTVADSSTGTLSTGLSAAQAHQLAALTPTPGARVAVPEPDRLADLAF